MPLSVAGKHAIITGAGSGINLAFTKLLLQRGCAVLIGDVSLRPEAERVLAAHPGQSYFQRTDVTSWRQLSALFDRGMQEFPQVDIVVAGAGVFEPAWSSFWHPPRTATNSDTPSADSADGEPGTYKSLDVNLTHPIRLGQLAVGYWSMRKMPGSLVVVGSIAGYMAGIGSPIYHASKFGVHGFVKSLGGLRDRLGIRVGCIAPGAVKTPMWDEEKKGMAGEKDTLISPEEIANAMLEMCENENYGDGTILEVLKNKTRVVPTFNAEPPNGDGMMVSGWNDMQEALFRWLKEEGLKV